MSELDARGCRLARAWTLKELSALLAGVEGFTGWIGKDGSHREVTGMALDSRLCGPGVVFAALPGARVDGHDFIPQAMDRGSRVFLVSEEALKARRPAWEAAAGESGACFAVFREVEAGLQGWAGAWLRSLGEIRRVGVTGSSGKTTTKELIVAATGRGRRVVASPGNMNSVLGLPLAVLSTGPGVDVAVFEMAMSERGEMDRLARMILPSHAIVTNVGTAHIGNIGSQAGIAEEKKKIFSCMGPGDTAYIPGDSPWAGELARDLKARVVLYGEGHTAGYEGWEAVPEGQEILWRGHRIPIAQAGAHIRADVLGAVSVAEGLGIAPDDIVAGLASFSAPRGRGAILPAGAWRVVDDCYNANPDSMSAGLRAFAGMPVEGRRIPVLGDMAELGDGSCEAHRQMGRLVASLEFPVAVFVGPRMEDAWREACALTPKAGHRWFADKDSAVEFLQDLPREGDLVYVKASRSMAMETLYPRLGLIVGEGHS